MEKWYQCKCDFCGVNLKRRIWDHPNHKSQLGYNRTGRHFCNRICRGNYEDKKIDIICAWCGKSIKKAKREIKKSKSGNSFCDKKCAASYNNTQRRKGRRSKIEANLFDMLRMEFPNLCIEPNDKDLLHGHEVDIALKELNLAIEWNGIVHYKPIYGKEKLRKIKEKDATKQFVAECLGVELIVVSDLVSDEKRLREAFLEIKQIIEQKLAECWN